MVPLSTFRISAADLPALAGQRGVSRPVTPTRSYIGAEPPLAVLSRYSGNSGQIARKGLFLLHLHPARNLNALCLWRAGTMQAFRQVADSVAADRHVLDQSQNFHAIDRIDTVTSLQKLPDKRADLIVLKVPLGWHRDDQTACNILREPGNFEGIPCYIVLCHVREHLVIHECPRLHRLGAIGTRHAA